MHIHRERETHPERGKRHTQRKRRDTHREREETHTHRERRDTHREREDTHRERETKTVSNLNGQNEVGLQSESLALGILLTQLNEVGKLLALLLQIAKARHGIVVVVHILRDTERLKEREKWGERQ